MDQFRNLIDTKHIKTEHDEEVVSDSCTVEYQKNEVFDARRLENNEHEDVLFSEDITEDDEIWVLQCPSEVIANSMNKKNIIMENGNLGSKMKLRCKNGKKTYQVHSFKSAGDHVNCILPSKRHKNFNINIFPLAGRVILQQSVSNMKHIIHSSMENIQPIKKEIKQEPITDEEESASSPKKKKKKIK